MEGTPRRTVAIGGDTHDLRGGVTRWGQPGHVAVLRAGRVAGTRRNGRPPATGGTPRPPCSGCGSSRARSAWACASGGSGSFSTSATAGRAPAGTPATCSNSASSRSTRKFAISKRYGASCAPCSPGSRIARTNRSAGGGARPSSRGKEVRPMAYDPQHPCPECGCPCGERPCPGCGH